MTEAVILAAGKGKRLQPITEEIPKAMALVNGKPITERILHQLKQVGVNHVVLVVHYFKEKVMEHFGDEFEGMKISYAEQKDMLGTGDAVLAAEEYVQDEKFFVVACDSVFETDLLRRLMKHDSDGVLTVCEVKDAKRFGVIEHDEKYVARIVEKSPNPPTNLANTSIYLFPRKIFDACARIEKSPRGEYEITDAIQLLIDEGTTFEFEVVKNWLDIGTLQQLEEAQQLGKKLT